MIRANVRGMGVADSTSVWGDAPLWANPERWATPKRCCSSVMTSPSLPYCTSSVSRAWVPMHRSMRPSASAASVSRRSLARVEPVSRAQVMPSRASSGDRLS